MKIFIKSKLLILFVFALMVFTTFNCGYILYPERRGNPPGQIDTGSLVMDILWLIPGLIPGAIALAVDFSTGAIYLSGGRKERRHHYSFETQPFNVHAGDKIALNLINSIPSDAEVNVTLASKQNQNNTISLLKRKLAKEDRSKDIVIISLPDGLDTGLYNIAVSVNGIKVYSLDLKVTI
jgi:hypothetical protein